MKTKKINIGIALSRNYDKISLEFLDEAIEYETEEELKEIVKKKYAFLKSAILEEFGTEKPQLNTQIPQKSTEMATEKQLSYLEALNFKGETKNLTKPQAQKLIKELLEEAEGYQNY